jgi:hypothetical protein
MLRGISTMNLWAEDLRRRRAGTPSCSASSRTLLAKPGADLVTSNFASATTSTSSALSTGGWPRPDALPNQAAWSSTGMSTSQSPACPSVSPRSATVPQCMGSPLSRGPGEEASTAAADSPKVPPGQGLPLPVVPGLFLRANWGPWSRTWPRTSGVQRWGSGHVGAGVGEEVLGGTDADAGDLI